MKNGIKDTENSSSEYLQGLVTRFDRNLLNALQEFITAGRATEQTTVGELIKLLK